MRARRRSLHVERERLAALAPEGEAQRRAVDLDVAVAQRGQAEGVVLRAYSSLPTRISVVSSSRTTVASTFSRGRPGRARSASTRRADARQRRAEGDHAVVLGLVAHLAPARVVAVLLAAPVVAAGGLEVAVRRAGRSRRRVQAGGMASERMRASVASSRTGAAVRQPVAKPLPARRARMPGLLVGDVAQPRLGRRFLGIHDARRGGGRIVRRGGGLFEGHGRRGSKRWVVPKPPARLSVPDGNQSPAPRRHGRRSPRSPRRRPLRPGNTSPSPKRRHHRHPASSSGPTHRRKKG